MQLPQAKVSMLGDTIDSASEKILLHIPTQREQCCHSAGSLFMHTNGEWNQARTAGNYGWPYFIPNNKPCIDHDFATGISTTAFDPSAPVNDSLNNTGPTNLPVARPAWLWYPYNSSTEFPELNGSGGRTAMGGPVYYYPTNVLTETKLPAYFDQTLFVWDWSRNCSSGAKRAASSHTSDHFHKSVLSVAPVSVFR